MNSSKSKLREKQHNKRNNDVNRRKKEKNKKLSNITKRAEIQ